MFEKIKKNKIKPIIVDEGPSVPDGLVCKCSNCGGTIIAEEMVDNLYICPKCDGYFRVTARARLNMVVDPDSFEEWDEELVSENPLDFEGYEEKLVQVRNKTELKESIVIGKAKIHGQDTVIGVCDSRFLMGSMGWGMGEKITRAVEKATDELLPIVLFACSGGARMQEGIVSLMQMSKTAAALKRHSDAGGLYISVLTDPTTGGVTASFAMLGDFILAEPKALIGFAGPRVIEQTIGQKLPKGFQRSEFLLKHGFIDRIVERKKMRKTLGRILKMHNKDLVPKKEKRKELVYPETVLSEMSSWDRVLRSRQSDRPIGEDYIRGLFRSFMECHGDRLFGDDRAIIGGVGMFQDTPVTVIAQAKGKNTKENIDRNFGMPSPEGYRKALRLMKQAEKFNRPIICLIDTPGAFPGMEAEEHGQGEAIAKNLFEMSTLKVPVLSIVIGEGGSGGALAMAVANEVWMLENSIYSILSPEGFASILWKDSSLAKKASEKMKLTAGELLEQGIIDYVIKEPLHLDKDSLSEVLDGVSERIEDFLAYYSGLSEQELVDSRYKRFRDM